MMAGALEATDLRAWAEEQVDMAPHIATLTRWAREARTIVEFGVRGAVSTWALLDGLPEDGRMWSVEINGNHAMPPRVTSDPRWTLILGDDMDPAVQRRLPTHADLVFLDTSHEYEHTCAELAFLLTLTPVRMILHDFVMEPVARAAYEFMAREGWRLIDNELPFGLATLEPL